MTMFYYRPYCRLYPMTHTFIGFYEKFGGYPWGFPIEKWPVCEWCKKPMSFIVQLKHDSNRFNLGDKDFFLYVFSCFEDFDEGKNNAVIIESHELTDDWTKPIDPIVIYPEVIITDWIKEKEGIDQLSCDPFNISEYSMSDDLDKVYPGTKAGGFPFWYQTGPSVSKPFEYLLQLDQYIDLHCDPLSADSIGYPIIWLNEEQKIIKKDQPKIFKYPESTQQFAIYVMPDGTMFTDVGFYGDGTAFVLIDRTKDKPEFHFYTECT